MGSVARPIYSLDDIPGVDLTSEAPASNDVLMYDGTNWVPVPEGTTFSFSVASFDDGESSPQLAGTAGAEWKAAGAITFSASYTNGPPTAAHIVKSGWSDLTLLTPFTSVVSAAAVNYPSPGSSVTFTLHAAKGGETDENNTATVAFYNYIFYGVSSTASGYSESDVEGLATSTISNTKGRTISVTAGSGEYIIYALPTRLGTVTFTVGGFEGGFESPETVSVTNTAGLTENYYVYRSTNANLGSTTVVVA